MFQSEAEKWEVLKRINHKKPNGIFARLNLSTGRSRTRAEFSATDRPTTLSP
jgi:hypothetical protein